MIEYGFLIFLGVLFLAWKLPTKTSLRLLNHALAVDIIVSVAVYALHWGTFSGVMAAAVAGLMVSIMTGFAKYLFGYIDRNTYYPGVIKLELK